MLTLPAEVILEKNKLFQSGSIIELLEWQISESGEVLRLANSNEDVIWGGYTWLKFWFEGGDVSDSGGDRAETIQVKVSAIDRVVQGYLEELTNGGIGDTVIYRRVHTDHLDLSAFLVESFEILNIDAGPDNEWVIFDLGQENLFLNQFPSRVTSRDVCGYQPYETEICPYTNSLLCSRSYDDCNWLNQQDVFGSQPGIPGGIFNIESLRAQLTALYLDAKLHKSGLTKTLSIDALIGGVHRTYLDAILIPGDKSQSLAIDALINVTRTTTNDLDALLNAVITSTLGIEAQLKLIGETSQTSLDAIIYGEIAIQIDGYLNKAQTDTVALDGLLESATTAQFFIDAIILLTQSATSLDAILIGTETTSTSLDAYLYGTEYINLDALIQSVDNLETFDIDAYLQGNIETTTQLDAKLNGEQTTIIGLEAQLYAVGSFYEQTKLDAILYGDYVEDTEGQPIADTDGDYIEEPD